MKSCIMKHSRFLFSLRGGEGSNAFEFACIIIEVFYFRFHLATYLENSEIKVTVKLTRSTGSHFLNGN